LKSSVALLLWLQGQLKMLWWFVYHTNEDQRIACSELFCNAASARAVLIR
jgi:hypothetical protein